jgi:hypothetical protein
MENIKMKISDMIEYLEWTKNNFGDINFMHDGNTVESFSSLNEFVYTEIEERDFNLLVHEGKIILTIHEPERD